MDELRRAVELRVMGVLLPGAMADAARECIDRGSNAREAIVAAHDTGHALMDDLSHQMDRMFSPHSAEPVIVRASDVPAIAGVDEFRSREDVLREYASRPPAQRAWSRPIARETSSAHARRVATELGKQGDRGFMSALIAAAEAADACESIGALQSTLAAFQERVPLADAGAIRAADALVRQRFGAAYQEQAAAAYLADRPTLRQLDRRVERRGGGRECPWVLRGEVDLLLLCEDKANSAVVVEIKTRTKPALPREPYERDVVQLLSYLFAAQTPRGELLEVVPTTAEEEGSRVTHVSWCERRWQPIAHALDGFAKELLRLRGARGGARAEKIPVS